VAVGFQLFCFWVRLGASAVEPLSIAIDRVMRLSATGCKTMQNRKLLTQNPPRATSWGFDPPSRHQHKSTIINYLPSFRQLGRDAKALLVGTSRVASADQTFSSFSGTLQHPIVNVEGWCRSQHECARSAEFSIGVLVRQSPASTIVICITVGSG
jgi:hypothetical protein